MIAALVALVASGCGATATAPKAATKPSSARPNTAEKPDPLPTSAEQAAAVARFARGGRPIYCGGRGHDWVALTFDDGPGPYTNHVLAMLNKYDVPATFFDVGRNVAQWPRRVARERNRHAAIGNHSWTHPVLPSLSAAEQRDQLRGTSRAISKITGSRVGLFRPPYMEHDGTTDRISRRLGMATILWNVDSRDSLGANSKVIARRVKRGLHPGAIILMHENHGQTVRALRYTILPELRRQGMQPVTIPQMLAGNPPTQRQLERGRRGCRRRSTTCGTVRSRSNTCVT